MIGCRKKEVGPQQNTESVSEKYYNVLVGCEGNFGSLNGSLSAYNSENNEIINNYFDQINNYALGDVVQYINEIDGDIYVVVNNSGKIEIIDSLSFISVGNINGLMSPREIKKVKNNFAYVSDLFSNSIQVVDLENKTISNSIPVSGWTESILVYDTLAYVACPGSNLVYKINTIDHQILDSVSVGDSPMNLVLDKNKALWVLCAGSWGLNNGTLEKLDLNTNSVIETVILNSSPSKLCKNSMGDKLYWIDGGIHEMDVDQSSLSSQIISSGTSYFYGLSIHPNSNEIYITDAVDFVQSGWLYRYSSNGNILDSVYTGINPQAIFFK